MVVTTPPAEDTRLPTRVVDAARKGVALALAGRPSTISDRLWAYEIAEAAERLLARLGRVGQIEIHASGENVSFRPLLGRALEPAWAAAADPDPIRASSLLVG
jgi:hypothetical protein